MITRRTRNYLTRVLVQLRAAIFAHYTTESWDSHNMLLRSTRTHDRFTVPHSSIDPPDPSTRESSVVSWFFISRESLLKLVEVRVATLVPYPATSRKFRRWHKIPDVTSFRVVGYCVGSAILVPLFVVIATASAIVTMFAIGAIVALLLGVIGVAVSTDRRIRRSSSLRPYLSSLLFSVACSELTFPLHDKSLRVDAVR